MNIPTNEELRALSQTDREVAVSIFMPTHEAGPETRENHIRFKNRLQEAKMLLSERGYDDKDIDGLLGSAQALVNDEEFWQHQRKGLAMFITPGESFEYRLPVTPEELTLVSNRFHLKPLMPLLTGDGRFYILAMNLNSVRLLEATRYSVSEVPLRDVPTSIDDALRYDDDPEPTLRAYAAAGTRGGGGDRLQAQGAEEPDRKENIRRFFTAFDNGLRKMLEPQGDRIPVVFAGNVSNFPIYQEANHYNGLIDDFVAGNPEEMSDEALHERAWEIVAPHFETRRGKDAEAFRVKAGSDPAHASADLQEILPAAHDSRVQTLFVPLGQHRWGRYDPEARTSEIQGEERADTYDLYDLAAVQTLLGGGTVYAVEPPEIPGEGELAAVYRF
jgi:hypothetical protein